MSNKTNIKEFVENLFGFVRDEYPQIEPAGLLQSRIAYGKYNPSAGHHIIDPILQDEKPHQVKKFSILERCLREADSSRIGLSNRHLSFFEMFVYTYYGENSKLLIEQPTKIFYELLINKLGLNKDKFLITILKECKIENLHLTEKDTEREYEIWSKLFGKDKVKRTKGRRNLFLARLPGAAGGTGVEIYYRINGKYVEIGSQLHYHYIFNGPNNIIKTTNGNFGNGLGLERLLMVLENKSSVYDISLIKPIKDILIKSLNDGTEQLYDDNINLTADHIRAITFVIWEKERQNTKLTNSQEKILRKFKKNLDSSLAYLGIDTKIYADLIDVIIDLYKDRFADLPRYKDKILEYLNS